MKNLRQYGQLIALSVHEKADFKIRVDKVTCYSDAIVVHLKIDGVLGLDFMKKNQYLVDVNNGSFKIKRQGKQMAIKVPLG